MFYITANASNVWTKNFIGDDRNGRFYLSQ